MRPLPSLLRTYATKPPIQRPSHLSSKKSPLSLDHFLIRQRVLAFYRSIVRESRTIPSPTREEMRGYAREEFERHREVEDLRQIRYLVSAGKAEMDRVRGQVGFGG